MDFSEQVHHDATYQDQLNPVLKPDKPWEAGWGRCKMGTGCPWNASLPLDEKYTTSAFASAFSGGLWWDPAAAIYKMWYRCGGAQCYATSHDGIVWEKPLDINPAGSSSAVPISAFCSQIPLDLYI